MRAAILLFLIALSEATIGVFVKLAGDAIPIYTLNFYGLCFAAVFLITAFLLFMPQALTFPWDNWRDTLIIGALIALQISVFNIAMTLAPIANVVIFWSVAPFFVFIFSALFLGEPARKIHFLIFAIAIVGIVIAKPLEGGHMTGNLIALGDGAIYAAMVTYMRNEGIEESDNDILWFIMMAALYLSPALLIAGPGDITHTVNYPALGMELPVMLWIACFGIISTGMAYLCISLVLKMINANIYSLVDIITSPILAAILGYLVFSEIPGTHMIIGGALLLAAGFWLIWDKWRAESKNSHQV